MPIDLGTYEFEFGENETKPAHHHRRRSLSPLSWSSTKRERDYADWTVLIRCSDDTTTDTGGGDDEKIVPYYVHKCQLGRRSDYFHRMFRSKGLVEGEHATCEITLKPTAAKAFPVMLDHIYSADASLAAGTEVAPALRHLSSYFGIKELFCRVNKFIRNDLTAKTAPTYWSESLSYNDDRLRKAVICTCAERFDHVDPCFLTAISPDDFAEMVTSPDLKCDSELLSIRVVDFLKLHPDRIDSHVLHSLTCPERMPVVAAEASIYLLKLDIDYPRKDTDEADGGNGPPPTLYSRCVKAFLKGSQSNPLLYPAEDRPTTDDEEKPPTKKQRREASEYESLSQDVRLKLSQSALCEANRQIAQCRAETEGLHEQLSLFDNDLSDNVLVCNAGETSVNGIYVPDGECDDCVMYTKEGIWDGVEKLFALFKFKSYWYISFLPHGTLNRKIVVYKNRSSGKLPPRDDWICLKNKPPICIVMS